LTAGQTGNISGFRVASKGGYTEKTGNISAFAGWRVPQPDPEHSAGPAEAPNGSIRLPRQNTAIYSAL
jgi:hypothetical protein